MATLKASLLLIDRVNVNLTAAPSFPIGRDISAMLAAIGGGYDNTNALIMAMYARLSQIATIGVARQDAIDDPLRMSHTLADGTVLDIIPANVPVAVPEDIKVFYANVTKYYAQVMTIIFDLVAANQVRRISTRHLKNYFAMSGNSTFDNARLMPHINSISGILPNLISDADLRVKVGDSDWVKYRTTAASSAGLVRKAILLVGDRLPMIYNDEVRALVNLAEVNRWDKARTDAIPLKVVAFTYAILKVYKCLPEEWYQGSKAVDTVSAQTMKRITEVAKKIKEFDEEIVAIDRVRTLDELQDLIMTFTDLDPAVPAAVVGAGEEPTEGSAARFRFGPRVDADGNPAQVGFMGRMFGRR